MVARLLENVYENLSLSDKGYFLKRVGKSHAELEKLLSAGNFYPVVMMGPNDTCILDVKGHNFAFEPFEFEIVSPLELIAAEGD